MFDYRIKYIHSRIESTFGHHFLDCTPAELEGMVALCLDNNHEIISITRIPAGS